MNVALPTRPNGEGIETIGYGMPALQPVNHLFRRALTEKGLKQGADGGCISCVNTSLPTRPNGEGIETRAQGFARRLG